MRGRGLSTTDLSKRVQDLRLYRTNVRRYSTLDFKERFQSRDDELAGFSAAAPRRRKTLHSGGQDGAANRALSTEDRGDPPKGAGQAGRAWEDDELFSGEDDELYGAVSAAHPRVSRGGPTPQWRPRDERGLRRRDEAVNAQQRRHHRPYSEEEEEDHWRQSSYCGRGRSDGRRENDSYLSDSGSESSARRHSRGLPSRGHSDTGGSSRARHRSPRPRYSSPSSDDSAIQRPSRPVSKGAWTRDTIIPASARKAKKSSPEEDKAERGRPRVERRPADRDYDWDKDSFREPHDLDEPLNRPATVTTAVERKAIALTTAPSEERRVSSTANLILAPKESDSAEIPTPTAADNAPAATPVVRVAKDRGLPPTAESFDDSSTATHADDPSPSLPHPPVNVSVSGGESPTDPQSTLRLLFESLEEQSRLRTLLDAQGKASTHNDAEVAEAKQSAEEAQVRLDNTLQELEKVVQQLVGVKAELEAEKRKNYELEQSLVTMSKQLEDAVGRQEEYKQEASLQRHSVRAAEDQLRQAEAAIEELKASPAPPNDGTTKDVRKENSVVAPSDTASGSASSVGPIKRRPNVHYYPASVPASDTVSAKEAAEVADSGYKDETSLYPPPLDSPPSSPKSSDDLELAAPRSDLTLDDIFPSPSLARPPLSPKPQNSPKDRRQTSVNTEPNRRDHPFQRKGEFVLLEINIGAGKQQGIRIDVNSQPLELAYNFLETQELNPEYLIPLTEYISQTQDKLIAELETAGSGGAKYRNIPAKQDSSDASLGEPYEFEESDEVVVARGSRPGESAVSKAANGSGSRLARIAKQEQNQQLDVPPVVAPAEPAVELSCGDTDNSSRPAGSKDSTGGFTFHTFEDETPEHDASTGDDSSLAFYLSPTASPGSNRRESGVTEYKFTPDSSTGSASNGDEGGDGDGNDLAGLTKLVETGRIQNIGDLLHLVQSASSQGISKLSQLSNCPLESAPDPKGAGGNDAGAVFERSGGSAPVTAATSCSSASQPPPDIRTAVRGPASEQGERVPSIGLDAPVSLSKPQRPTRGVLRPGEAASSPSSHVESKEGSDPFLEYQTTGKVNSTVVHSTADHKQRIHRHEKDDGSIINKRSVIDEVEAGESGLKILSEPSPSPPVPSLIQRHSFLERHPNDAASRPFILSSHNSSSSESDTTLSSESDSDGDRPTEDIDVVPLEEEEEDLEDMCPDEAAVVKAYIDHILNPTKNASPTHRPNNASTGSRTHHERGFDAPLQTSSKLDSELQNPSRVFVLRGQVLHGKRPGVQKPTRETGSGGSGAEALTPPEKVTLGQNHQVPSTAKSRANETRSGGNYRDVIRSYEAGGHPESVSEVRTAGDRSRVLHEHRPFHVSESGSSGIRSRPLRARERLTRSENAVSSREAPSKSDARPVAFGDYGVKGSNQNVRVNASREMNDEKKIVASARVVKPTRAPPSVVAHQHSPRQSHLPLIQSQQPPSIVSDNSPSPTTSGVTPTGESLSELLVRLENGAKVESDTNESSPNKNGGLGHGAMKPDPVAKTGISSKARLNALLLHPELLPYMRADIQRTGVLEKRHHSFSTASSPMLSQLNPFKQEWRRKKYVLDFNAGSIFYFSDSDGNREDDVRGVIALSAESEVQINTETAAAATCFELTGVSRESKRRGHLTLLRSPAGRVRYNSDISETETASEAEDGCGNDAAISSEVITLRAGSSGECSEWVHDIRVAIKMVSLALTEKGGQAAKALDHGEWREGHNNSDGKAAISPSQTSTRSPLARKNASISSAESIGSFDFGTERPVVRNNKSPLRSQASAPVSVGSPIIDDVSKRAHSMNNSADNRDNETKEPGSSPSLWNRVRSAVSPLRSNKSTEITGKSEVYTHSLSGSEGRPSNGVFFTPSPVQSAPDRASPWSPLPAMNGTMETAHSPEARQYQLEQQVINSFKRTRTTDQSHTLNDDSYISDLEEAGCMFERATELAKGGSTAEAVPLFLVALKEFERLQLPELSQIQDEIGYWLEAMETEYSKLTAQSIGGPDGEHETNDSEDDEFFSPEREEVQSVQNAGSTQHPRPGISPSHVGRVDGDFDGMRKAESPSPVVPSAAFYDVL